MSTEEMTRARREQMISQSPILQELARNEEAQQADRRSQVTVPEWDYTPEELEMIQSDDGDQVSMVPINPDAMGVRQDLDMVQMQLDDDDRGYDRPKGQWSPQYLRPNRRTVRGRDLATGEKILERGDSNNQKSQEHLSRSLELLRSSNNSILDGPDGDGMRGLTHLARSIQAEDLNFDEFARSAEMYSAPESALLSAWGAADAANTQETLDAAFASPVSQAEIDEIQTSEPLYSEGGLVLEDRWLNAAKSLWEVEHREPYSGTDKALSEWAIQEMTNFNWSILPGLNTSSMAYYATRAWYESQYDDGKYAQALYDLIEMYDNTETDLNTIGRSVVSAFRDPSMYIGASSVSKPVVKAVAKNRMTKWLSNVIGQKAAQRVGQNALVGTVEGAAYTGAEDAMRQSVAINAGQQEKFDVGQNAASMAVGATVGNAAGAVFGEVLSPQARQMYRAAGSRMLKNTGKPRLVSLQTGAVGDLSQIRPGKMKKISSVADLRKSQIKNLWLVLDGNNEVGQRYAVMLEAAEPDSEYAAGSIMATIKHGRSNHDKAKAAARLVALEEVGGKVTPAMLNQAYTELSKIPEFARIMNSEIPADMLMQVNSQRSFDAQESAFRQYLADNSEGNSFLQRRFQQIDQEVADTTGDRASRFTDEDYAQAIQESSWYHGAPEGVDVSDLKGGGDGGGMNLLPEAIYLTPSKNVAEDYGNNVLSISAEPENPLVLDYVNDRETYDQIVDQLEREDFSVADLIEQGYDAVWFKYGNDQDELAVFSPEILRDSDES